MNSDIVRKNIKSLLGVLGNFPGAGYRDDGRGITAYDGGVNDAYENYALLAPGFVTGAIESGLAFFRNAGGPNIWPLFPGIGDDACLKLENAGLARGDDFQAMTAEIRGPEFVVSSGASAEMAQSPDEARAWANCAWRGFDSGEDAPESFVSVVSNMARLDCFSLIRIGDEATGMLFASGATCGIYYVATRPEARGQGLAGAIVEKLKSRARELGFGRVALLATPSGRKLYLKRGFVDRGTVKIYKNE